MDIVKGNSQLQAGEFTGFNEEWDDFECDAQLESICEQSVVIGSTSPWPLPRFCCKKMSISS